MNKTRFSNRFLPRFLVIVILALALSAAIAWFQVANDRAAPRTGEPRPVAGVRVGGPFSMTDHTGRAVTDRDFAGQYKLIYFGFTFCPAICPTELAKMTAALNRLDDQAARRIQPLFVSVDPARDTVPVMQSYVAQFHPRLIGLTGTPEQTNAMLKTYRVYAAKVKDPAMSDYVMDHSSFLYFMDPEDNLLAVFDSRETPDTIAARISPYLE